MKKILLKSFAVLAILASLTLIKFKEVHAEAEIMWAALIYCQCNDSEDGQKCGCITTETSEMCLYVGGGEWEHPDESTYGEHCYEYGHHGDQAFLCAPEPPPQ